jgi:putative RecB family exonuclease
MISVRLSMHESTSQKEVFAVSDIAFLSPSRLATYADCPRKFDYNYVQKINAPDETRLYLNQGRAYHETIEVVCEATEPNDEPEIIYGRAMDAFATKWNQHLNPDEYASSAHQEYQRRENQAAIESFFHPDGGDGIEHARKSVATEKWLECVHDGLGLHGKADNILETDDGLHVIDYKRKLDGVITMNKADVLIDHLERTDHDAKRVRNAFQIATYIEGIKQSTFYEEGMSVRFSFYGLLQYPSFEERPDGYEISVRGSPRETTDIYEQYYDTIWDLIERAHNGITSGSHDPEPFGIINEEACPDCSFSTMCSDYLAEEVRR